jgi:hypothetical protein
MNKAATMATSEREAGYRAKAEYYLAETNKILKRLANERLRHARRYEEVSDIRATIKAILRGS